MLQLTVIMAESLCTMRGGDEEEERRRSFSDVLEEFALATLWIIWMKLSEGEEEEEEEEGKEAATWQQLSSLLSSCLVTS